MMKDSNKRTTGMIAVGIFGSAAVGLLVGSVPFVLPAVRKICLPYVPATNSQIKNITRLLRNRRGNVIDLGSGDGRVTNLQNFENVIIFGVEQMMPHLEEKLAKELTQNGCVIACRYPLPNWKVTKSVGRGIDKVWLYEKNCALK
ncbi:ATP synthase subunit C lysine N-methyltransferase-like isoform X2 [Stegodyphus dumicola]|uniref:ATP synthase subunit C lysine N-methyltransferase-like isoform X2 n=1 Tax=Stegodyphus dumicola TaxID=202533 RepID=UPI0015A89522|nr:ATP synthase subunit C lysine N-methyltransferase-like isoform X2 [Stegodyphus dumicola]